MPSAGFLIFSGVMPLIKTFLSILIGYVLARKGLFPPAASKGASQVTMNVSLPLLIFSNIVPAFTPQNVSAMGPLFLTAFVYQILGFLFGFIIREVFYVPRNFWQGIIVLCGMSNWGNLPNAVVLTVTQQAPFNPDIDPALGVSFVSIFIVAYHLVFWVCGAAHSLSWDYLPGIPQGEAAEQHISWKEKPLGSLFSRFVLGDKPKTISSTKGADVLEIVINEKDKDKDIENMAIDTIRYSENLNNDLARRTSHISVVSRHTSLGPRPSTDATPLSLPSSSLSEHGTSPTNPPETHKSTFLSPTLYRIFHPLAAIVNPVTVSLIISLPIALIQPLKALFVDVSNIGGPSWKGPDGRPPLAFVIDTAEFLGTITVPLALILLGASFARFTIPRPLSRLPIAAMVAVALAKMLVMPVIGVLMVMGMVKGGLIDENAKVEKFVAMFLSGTPAAVNQLIVASLYSPDGNVDTLAAFLLVQYGFLFFSSSALTAIALLLS
ncbi:hypothetical protein QCA50_007209 [Cerrena zonata]|uniref:Auxin efflux carrier n=1 Tax=Cerrena zonata TaxID=2478898 RepID=A0AAW0GD03_9APHY